jgi:thymidylate synthase
MQERFLMSDGFPLVTTRKIYTRALIEELLFFIEGGTNANNLKALNVNICTKFPSFGTISI